MWPLLKIDKQKINQNARTQRSSGWRGELTADRQAAGVCKSIVVHCFLGCCRLAASCRDSPYEAVGGSRKYNANEEQMGNGLK